MPTLVHLGDIHFGHPELPAAVAAVERRFAQRSWDVIAISGDLTQRNTRWQFVKARAFMEKARAAAPTVVIPGNHDVAWWWCVLGVGVQGRMYRGYRKWISADLEPSLRVPGVTVVCINTSHGVQRHTLTTRVRDISIVGAMRPAQLARATSDLASAQPGDLRVLMVHHNVLRGTLSNRWGLVSRAGGLNDVAATGCELVLCGHDHEAQVERVERGGRRYVVSQVNTLSNRSRGGRPVSFHEIAWDAATVAVTRHEWSVSAGDFAPAQSWAFAR